MPLSYNYDRHDRRDILRHAKALEGHVVGDVYELELNGKHRDNVLQYYAEKCIQGWTDADGTSHRGDKVELVFWFKKCILMSRMIMRHRQTWVMLELN